MKIKKLTKRKKNETIKNNRRYFKLYDKDAHLMKCYFKKYIMDGAKEAKSSMSRKTAILNLLKKYPIFMNKSSTPTDHVSIVNAKVYNERQKACSSVQNLII